MSGSAYRVVVRVATEADLAQLVRLRSDWSTGKALSAEDDHDFADRMARWWQRQGGMRRAWLALADGPEPGGRPAGAERAVGMVNLAVFERMPRPGLPDARWAYVGNLWVDPRHRRRGVASAMMTEVLAWCRAEDMDRVVLNPSEMGRGVYARLGFRPAADLLRLDL